MVLAGVMEYAMGSFAQILVHPEKATKKIDTVINQFSVAIIRLSIIMDHLKYFMITQVKLMDLIIIIIIHMIIILSSIIQAIDFQIVFTIIILATIKLIIKLTFIFKLIDIVLHIPQELSGMTIAY